MSTRAVHEKVAVDDGVQRERAALLERARQLGRDLRVHARDEALHLVIRQRRLVLKEPAVEVVLAGEEGVGARVEALLEGVVAVLDVGLTQLASRGRCSHERGKEE